MEEENNKKKKIGFFTILYYIAYVFLWIVYIIVDIICTIIEIVVWLFVGGKAIKTIFKRKKHRWFF